LDDEALVRQAAATLPEIGKLLHAAAIRHPMAAGRSLAQVKTLVLLHHRERSTVGEIAAGLGVAMPTASELVDRLVEGGLAERATNPIDRRQVLVWLTPEAREFGDQLYALRCAQVRATFDRLELDERMAFARGLQALAAVLREETITTKF
jgi:DNA-binding MarR family transcriptional regulator